MNHKDFYHRNGVKAQSPEELFDEYSWTDIEPLKELHGRKWDDFALAYVHSLRPTTIRVILHGATLNSIPGRVTVWLEDDNETIHNIEQEITIPIPPGFEDGHDMMVFLETGEHSDGATSHHGLDVEAEMVAALTKSIAGE
jgi:hypothetical protein